MSHSQARLPAPEVLPSTSPTTRPEASAPDVSDKLPQGAAGPTAQPDVPSPSASPAGTGGSDTANTLLPISPLHDPVIRGGGGSGAAAPQPTACNVPELLEVGPTLQCPNLNPRPELLITDVVLNETGLSILGQAAPGSLQPDYAGRAIALTLTGTFRDAQQAPLALPDFLFTLAPPLIQQTFTGTEPQARVLLDDSILLEVTAVTATEIQAVLQTGKLPDLYLKGLHKLSVEQGDWYTNALIQVGDPVPPADSLQPVISSVDVLRDTQNRPVNLRLRGQHFMVSPKFSYTTVDGVFGFGSQTEVTTDGQFETLVHIPSPETFDQLSEHTVIMATPFGVAFKAF